MIKNLAGKTIFISGGSRGIGLAIALRAAQDGANIILAAKTAEPNPKLPGTIYTAATEIEKAGGSCFPAVVDIRYEDQVQKAMEDGAKQFGGIDILVNNASAISLTGTLNTTMKKYDLMNTVNTRGTYLCSKLAIPYLKKSKNPHILTLSPPLYMSPRWFKDHAAYTIAKYGMSMCVLGMSHEFKDDGIAVNALWPRTGIQTAAIDLIAGDMAKHCRKAEIMADAAYVILSKKSHEFTGQFVIDEDLLRKEGVTDFEKYAMAPGNDLMLDFFLDEPEYKDGMFIKVKKPEAEKKAVEQPKASAEASAGSDTEVGAAMKSMSSLINPELVQKVQAVYAFNFSDTTPTDWYLDLKNGSGGYGAGAPPAKANCVMKLKSKDFVAMINGSLKPTTAFMTGKLKITGDLSLAMKLEKLFSSLKSKL